MGFSYGLRSCSHFSLGLLYGSLRLYTRYSLVFRDLLDDQADQVLRLNPKPLNPIRPKPKPYKP